MPAILLGVRVSMQVPQPSSRAHAAVVSGGDDRDSHGEDALADVAHAPLVVWRRPPAPGQVVDGQQRTPTAAKAARAQPQVLPMIVEEVGLGSLLKQGQASPAVGARDMACMLTPVRL